RGGSGRRFGRTRFQLMRLTACNAEDQWRHKQRACGKPHRPESPRLRLVARLRARILERSTRHWDELPAVAGFTERQLQYALGTVVDGLERWRLASRHRIQAAAATGSNDE